MEWRIVPELCRPAKEKQRLLEEAEGGEALPALGFAGFGAAGSPSQPREILWLFPKKNTALQTPQGCMKRKARLQWASLCKGAQQPELCARGARWHHHHPLCLNVHPNAGKAVPSFRVHSYQPAPNLPSISALCCSRAARLLPHVPGLTTGKPMQMLARQFAVITITCSNPSSFANNLKISTAVG